MGAPSTVLRSAGGDLMGFRCPGCNDWHHVKVGEGPRPRWKWNGDVVRPTFDPSVLVTCGHYVQGHSGDCWCTYNAAHPEEKTTFGCYRCHSFVKNGQIQFLDDCSHALAGQTVPLPPIET